MENALKQLWQKEAERKATCRTFADVGPASFGACKFQHVNAKGDVIVPEEKKVPAGFLIDPKTGALVCEDCGFPEQPCGCTCRCACCCEEVAQIKKWDEEIADWKKEQREEEQRNTK